MPGREGKQGAGRVGALVLMLALAQAPASARAGDAPAAGEQPARVGQTGVFRLRSGATLAGTWVSSGPGEDVVRLESGQLASLPAGSVVARVGEAEGAAPAPGADDRRVRVFLRDGRTVVGELVRRDGEAVTIRREGREESFAPHEVREVFELRMLRDDRGGPSDPSRARHVHAPSAIGLEPRALLLTFSAEGLSAGYGLLPWATVSAGLATPLVSEGEVIAPSMVLGADTRLRLLPRLHASVGLVGFAAQEAASLHLRGALTYGTAALSITAWGGPPVAGAGRLGRFDADVLGLAGTARVLPRLVLVAEAWAPPRSSPDVAGAASLRWLVGRFSLEAGAVGSTGPALLPWFAVAWQAAGEVSP